jgi:hypothetical protein
MFPDFWLADHIAVLVKARDANNHNPGQVTGFAKRLVFGFNQDAVIDEVAQELSQNTAIFAFDAKPSREALIVKPVRFAADGF